MTKPQLLNIRRKPPKRQAYGLQPFGQVGSSDRNTDCGSAATERLAKESLRIMSLGISKWECKPPSACDFSTDVWFELGRESKGTLAGPCAAILMYREMENRQNLWSMSGSKRR